MRQVISDTTEPIFTKYSESW